MTEIVNTYREKQKSVQQHNSYNITKQIAADGKVSLNLTPIPKDSDKNWIIRNSEGNKKRMFLVFLMAMILISGAFVIGITVTKHTQNAKHYCESVRESVFYENGTLQETSVSAENLLLLQSNPELFLWDHCVYKVFPFVEDDKYRCQCRVFVIEDWMQLQSTYQQRTLDLNLTQQNMINGMLQHWFMLEKFRSNGNSEPVYSTYDINASLFNARYMKAFEWTDSVIVNIEDGISYWRGLEFLKLANIFAVDQLPQDMEQLTNIRVLFLWNVGLQSFPGCFSMQC